MRVIIILASIALAHGAKLERTYLPPSNARTAGGSGNFLQTPISGPGSSGSGPAWNYNAQAGFNQGNSGAIQANDYAQSGNDFSQSGNDFSQSGDLLQTGAQYGNVNFNNFAEEARPERPRAAFERNAAILRQDSSNDGDNFSYAYETENGIYAEENGVATNGVEAQGGYSYTGDDGQVYSVRYTADQNGFVPQGDHLPTPPPVPEEILKALEQNARDEAAGIYDDGSYNEGKYAAADNNNQYNYQQNTYNADADDTIVTNSAQARTGPTYNTLRNGLSPTYGTPNGPSGNSGIDQTYGTPSNTPSFTSGNSAIAPAFGARSYSAPSNAASFAAPTAGSGSSSFAIPNAGAAKNSGVEKAYLPPFAEQRDQPSNSFGRRQQSFDARTGYKY